MAQVGIYALRNQFISPAEGGCYRVIGILLRVIPAKDKREAIRKTTRINRLLKYRYDLYRRGRHYSDYEWYGAKFYEGKAPEYYASGSAYYE